MDDANTQWNLWVCRDCGSTQIEHRAYAHWDIAKQEWDYSLADDSDDYCEECGDQCRSEYLTIPKSEAQTTHNKGHIVKVLDTWKGYTPAHDSTLEGATDKVPEAVSLIGNTALVCDVRSYEDWGDKWYLCRTYTGVEFWSRGWMLEFVAEAQLEEAA